MVIDERTPKWRNALTWTAASFVALLVYTLGISALIQDGPVGSRLGPAIAIIGTSVLAASMLIGFSYRTTPFNRRTFASFLVLTALALAMFMLVRWLLAEKISLHALGPSVAISLVFGTVLVTIAAMACCSRPLRMRAWASCRASRPSCCSNRAASCPTASW